MRECSKCGCTNGSGFTPTPGNIAKGVMGAYFNIFITRGRTITGQKSKGAWICADCKTYFAVCPFCDDITESDLIQVLREIKCTHCRETFVVG
jgi:DNA-directed RNA polymerase subunit RPC12/RpoP